MSDVLDVADGLYDGPALVVPFVQGMTLALTAASFPVKPPRQWFDDPKLREVTPLTVTSDGHVYGHIATWRQSHIGMAGAIKAPRSSSDYAFFRTGVLETDSGEMINVGQITLAGGHAPLEASVADTVAHYDNTASAVMDVAAGEDRHGIWVAGALRPDVDDLKLRAVRASSVSGDWRPINGNLELVAVCAVNVPGFPIPRARVAGGQPLALVAAGTEEIAEAAVRLSGQSAVTAALDALDARMRVVEDMMIARLTEARESLPVTAAADVEPTEEPEAWEDGFDMDLTTRECLQASLRARARGLTAGGAEWTPGRRDNAAAKGYSLPDGSYPIASLADLKNAIRALGRAKNRAAVVKHIKKRAAALGHADLAENLTIRTA